MAVGIGIKGRQRVLILGGGSPIGVQTKGLSLNNTRLDTTDDNSSGWAEATADGGLKSVAFTADGVLKNLELMNSYFGSSQAFALTLTYPDNSVVSGDFFMDSFEETGTNDELTTFTASFSSTGTVTFTPGT